LADREHEHARIVRVVHVVHEPVAVRAVATANARESGALVVATSRIGVSPTSSLPLHPVPSSPQMWKRFSQWPISWVAVLPLSNGAVAVPFPALKVYAPKSLEGASSGVQLQNPA
jgi:hypothetical protein